MASTSISSSFPQVAESAPCRSTCDVFISDAKHPLAGVISEKLKAVQLKVFLNSEEHQLAEVQTAIKCASLYFIILSKDHAQSSRCLEELAFIQRRRKGRRIVPIFYHVKPEDLRYLKGDYSAAFDRYKREGKHTSKKLHKWKKALFRVSHSIGPIVNNKEDEDVLLKKVSDWVAKEGKMLPLVREEFSESISTSPAIYNEKGLSGLKAFLDTFERREEPARKAFLDQLRLLRKIKDFLEPLVRYLKEREDKETEAYWAFFSRTRKERAFGGAFEEEGPFEARMREAAFGERMENERVAFMENERVAFLEKIEKEREAILIRMRKEKETYGARIEKEEGASLARIEKEEETFLTIVEKEKEAFLARMERTREAFLARMERLREAFMKIFEGMGGLQRNVFDLYMEWFPFLYRDPHAFGFRRDQKPFLDLEEHLRYALNPYHLLFPDHLSETVERKPCLDILHLERRVKEERKALHVHCARNSEYIILLYFSPEPHIVKELREQQRDWDNAIEDLFDVVGFCVARIGQHKLKRQRKLKKALSKVLHSEEDEDFSGSYDVFINHRGPDTKQTLAKGIYKKLKEIGLRPFLDSEELEWGDHVPSVLEKVMKNAKVHIAIFSNNYAQSKWCLRELSFMRSKTSTQIIPIFYHCKLKDVRYIKGNFADAFEQHEKKSRFKAEQLHEWKEMLHRTSWNLGPVLKCKEDEDMLLKNIPSVCKEFVNVKVDERLKNTHHKPNSVLKFLLSLFKI